MKRIYVIILFVLLANLISAQNSYISLSMGTSIPVGTYSGEDQINTTGYAGPSFTLSFDGNYFFIPYFGITGIANYGMNATDEETLENDWIEYLKDLYPDVIIPDDATVQFSTDQWNYVNLMAGPVLSFPISKFSIEIKARGGMSYIRPPKREIYITYQNTEIYGNATGQSVKFGYLVGGGILYQPNDSYGVRLNADYFSTKAKIDLDRRKDDDQLVTETIELPVTAFHVTLGIAYFF